MQLRRSGVLLHITSLPSHFGIGDLGPTAYRFANYLEESNFHYWQILPLNPTDTGVGNSPYTTSSVFAGNPLLISPVFLVDQDLLDEKDLLNPPDFSQEMVEFERVIDYKYDLYEKAFVNFNKKESPLKLEYEAFCEDNAHWLDDYARFITFKQHFYNKSWNQWDAEIRDRDGAAIHKLENQLKKQIEYHAFLQFIFFSQWNRLKDYCNEKKIRIIGDMPYYVSYDSADVWTNPELFKLDGGKNPEYVGGVPPDYFSSTGQLWGNPVFNWDILKETDFKWWVVRFSQNFKFYDLLRIDHFRAFAAYWEVPAGENTAVNGEWIEIPSEDFFDTMFRNFFNFPVIAEDLGTITPDVRELKNNYDFPGMKVLMFAFGGDPAKNPYIPHNHIKNCILYTGTHDNNTLRGWFEEEVDEKMKQQIESYLGCSVDSDSVSMEFIRLALMSVADAAILPMQDILSLGADARMNKPGTTEGNWLWRMREDSLTDEIKENYAELNRVYGRE